MAASAAQAKAFEHLSAHRGALRGLRHAASICPHAARAVIGRGFNELEDAPVLGQAVLFDSIAGYRVKLCQEKEKV